MTELVLERPQPYYENHPWFFDQWRERHKRNKNMILCSTGQSLGIGKSHWLLDAFEEIDPSFTIDQVVFTTAQFWYAVDLLPSSEWHPIMWDDPTRGLQKRDWYLDVNKTVTSFMKTASRYKRKDVGFAVPTFDDLDIAVREIMVVEAQMEEAEQVKGWKRIYELVKASPENYRVQDPRNPQNPGRLSARKISALLDCSDNTARKVVTKIEFENA